MKSKEYTEEHQSILTSIVCVLDYIVYDEGKKLRLADSYIDEYGTLVVEIGGGENGNGNWVNYFANLSRFVKLCQKHEIEAWMIDAKNDCLDDVFNVRFGIKKMEIPEE